jgi:hypothetical protein
MSTEEDIMFVGVIANGATQFVPVVVVDGCVGAHIKWPDATSSATITLELSSDREATLTSVAAGEWLASGVTVTGPTGVAAGGSLVNVENVRQLRGRLKIVAAATTTLEILRGIK